MKKLWFRSLAKNEGYTASLELRKIYELISDARAAGHQMIRVIDKSNQERIIYIPLIFLFPSICQNLSRKLYLLHYNLGECSFHSLLKHSQSPGFAFSPLRRVVLIFLSSHLHNFSTSLPMLPSSIVLPANFYGGPSSLCLSGFLHLRL